MRANEQVIGVLETIAQKYGRFHRGRIEHLQIADPKDLPRLKPAGIVASMQPTHQTSDRTMAEARLGPNRLGGAYAWASILKLGVPLAFGSDFPVESPDPFPGLMAAISRQDLQGRACRRLAPAGKADARTSAPRLHPRRGLCRLHRKDDRARSNRANGPTSSSSTAIRPPSRRKRLARTMVLETWVGGEKVFSGSPAPAR